MKRPTEVFNYTVNSSDDQLDIHIDGQIVDAETQDIYEKWFGDETSVSFRSFRNQVESSTARTINVYVNSGGGVVTDAMAIHDYLKNLQTQGKTVNTIGRGIVASAATYILMAGPKPEMTANSWFMIHNVSGFAWGDVNEVERQANILRQFNDRIRDFYANATGIRKEDITKMMNDEKWMTPEEAKNKGFISKVTGESLFANAINPDHWCFKNRDVLAAYNSCVQQPKLDIHQLLLNQTNDMKNFLKSMFDGLKTNFKPAENATPSEVAAQLVDALEKPFETLGTEIENYVASEIKKNFPDVENRITDALKKEYDVKITALENKNTELQQEIANSKGKQSSATNTEDGGRKRIGRFTTASSND